MIARDIVEYERREMAKRYQMIPQELEEAYRKAKLANNPRFEAGLHELQGKIEIYVIIKSRGSSRKYLSQECEWTTIKRIALVFQTKEHATRSQQTYGGLVIGLPS